MIKNLLLVALGGGVGSALRYFIQEGLHKQLEGFAPYGTFVVNIVGCFLIGLFMGWAQSEKYLSEDTNLLLISGFCGGFTTFSTFAMQSNELMLGEKPLQAILYVGLSVVVGMTLAYLGYKLGKIS
ncbi:MAG: fluoride efflux transporter CrcB [Bacteroidota bacterium]|jgi:CrcB protein|uniref:fluoride efflux transporter CrcB n=1 Tax=Roseivirga sp. UBA838 TaxID=1947393 RepID=UPI00257F90BB|nr:fluoride efflux transporter CrcB [Roseivirga sp. UBA838]MEC7754665.1 fluoride efflux transporter CrcB [Bacteroidota bacterium]|tara:strand:- start:21143 stop:21520 length:378 start_codon:yes stop_codon:yes gene_type:complete